MSQSYTEFFFKSGEFQFKSSLSKDQLGKMIGNKTNNAAHVVTCSQRWNVGYGVHYM